MFAFIRINCERVSAFIKQLGVVMHHAVVSGVMGLVMIAVLSEAAVLFN